MKKLLLLLGLIISLPVLADVSMNQTLYLTVVNETNKTFSYQHILASTPGAQIWLDLHKDKLKPGKTTIIKVESVLPGEVFTEIAFKDQYGNDYRLKIFDPEQRKNVQPEFYMFGANVSSTVASRTRNSHIGGQYLLYTNATLVLK